MIPLLSRALLERVVSINLEGEAGAAIPPHPDLGDALSSQRRSAAFRAEPLRVSLLRTAAAIAGQALCGVAFLYLFIFAFGAVA